MTYFVIKILVTALIVALISELSRRYNLMAAALASLPLVSILAFIWINLESNNTQRLIVLSQDIFWLVLPSLSFFLLFPLLLKQGWTFWGALIVACFGMIVLHAITLWLLKTFTWNMIKYNGVIVV